MAEETIKRITGSNPNYYAMPDITSISIQPFERSPSDTSTDSAVPVQDDPNNHFYQPISSNPLPSNDQRANSCLTEAYSVDNMRQNSEPATATRVNKIGRAASLQRVASLEHLQKRIRGEQYPCGQ